MKRALAKIQHDMACFAAQQCTEKYLKASLEEAGISFPITHDLVKLLKLILPVKSAWNLLQADLVYLNAFAVDYRYPGVNATKMMAQDAIKSCRNVRKVIRTTFGLPV